MCFTYYQLTAGDHCLHSNMGYTDGKSESDVLIEEGDIDEDFGQIQVMKVTNHTLMYIFPFQLIYLTTTCAFILAHCSVPHTLCMYNCRVT